MSEEKKNTTTFLQEQVWELATSNKVDPSNRFIPSGIEVAGYEQTELRKWEWYQLANIRDFFKSQGISKLDDVVITDENERHMAQVLQSCLVKGKKIRTLFRPGSPGVTLLLKQVPRQQMQAALTAQLENCEVFRD